MKRIILLALVIGVVAGAAIIQQSQATRLAESEDAPVVSSVPVSIAEATRREVPIYLAGLGTVQASNTTAVRAQVEGKLQSVSFVEGQEVHKGEVLAQVDPRSFQAALDQAKAKKAEDEAQLVSAQKDLGRDRTLVAKSFETPQNLDHQIAFADQTKATIEADQAAIESAQTELDYTTITAPTDGRMGIRQIDPGNIVQITDPTPIAILTQTRPISIVFTLPERNLSAVRQAMAHGPVTAMAYDQDDAQLLGTGRLVLIDNEIDQTTSTVRLKATFPNDDETLWPGEFVHARVLVDTRKDAVTIPSVAVKRGPQGFYTWIVRADNTVEAQPVDAGPTQGDVTIINSGISADDRVVVDGQYRLQPGSHVDIKSARTGIPKGAA